MKSFSFYSYKGGVGRSTLLCNVARVLADEGKKVACIDCDIESTGLQPILRQRALRHDASALQGILVERSENRLIDLIDGAVDAIPMRSGEGRILLIPAAINHRQTRKVNEVMSSDRDLVFNNLDTLIGRLETEFKVDYVFFDSRAGISDMAEPALQYADGVVIAFRLGIQQQIGVGALLQYLMDYYPALGRFDVEFILQASNIPDEERCLQEIKVFTDELLKMRTEVVKECDMEPNSFPMQVMQPIWANRELQDYGSRVLIPDKSKEWDETINRYKEIAHRL